MPLLTDYQNVILESLKEHDFQRILRMKGSCHDALIGEWINWWLGQDIDGMICNPARGSKAGSRRYVADLLFLEEFEKTTFYKVKGVAEIENNKEKFPEKLKSLASYENYAKQGAKVYPDLEFAIFCYTLDVPDNEMAEKVYNDILHTSENSNLLWITCEISNSLREGKELAYSIRMPNYVRGYDYFWYCRNFSSVLLYGIKSGKQIQEIVVPRIKEEK